MCITTCLSVMMECDNQITITSMIFSKLRAFRQSAYKLLGKSKDALFELMDAVLTSAVVTSLVMLSLSPLFRRQWPSVYAALERSQPDGPGLLKLYVEQIPTTTSPLLVGDHTPWPRPEAKTLKDRTVEHQPTPIPGNKPITLGHGYSTLAWIPEGGGSWALPIIHERITSFETSLGKAADQLNRGTKALSQRPIVLYDREYGNAPFVNQTKDIPADLLLRLRPNLVVWGVPPAYSGRGRPRKHGDKFKLSDPGTWPEPSQTLDLTDPKLGQVQVRSWSGYHFRKAAARPMTLLRVECTPTQPGQRQFPTLWVAWVGETPPPLKELWDLYLQRSAIEHWYRFAKQRLHWTQPQLADTTSTERWSAIMPILTWQLWLAREEIVDQPLPWQKPQTDLTPGRVAQGFATVLAVISTPAQPPKPRGKSPGYPAGQPRKRRIRYPIVIKGTSSSRKKIASSQKPPS